jgi:LPXTG-motif cell wall-anchored protein
MATELPSDQADEAAEPGAMPVTASEPAGADPGPMIAALEPSSSDEHSGGSGGGHSGGSGGSGGGHSGGSGGSGGSGDPYRITFVVSWRLPDDSTIPVLDDVLPADWREMFDLAAASATGGGKPTSAYCTYPPGSTDLVCEFRNPGHGSDADGMVVPKKKTATYTVTVLWPTSGWTIDGANAGPYSARDLCPHGGHDDGGHNDGHDGGHGETLEAAALDESGSGCVHTVVMRRAAVTADSPAAEPPAPPASEVPAASPPASQTPVTPEAAATPPAVEALPVTVTPRALPATGNTATTTLMIGTIILALGGGLFALARRRDDLPVS